MVACASSWPGAVLLVEASEEGGALAARFGLAVEPGLTTLAAASRHDTTGGGGLVGRHTQSLPGSERITALLGPPSMEPAQALLRSGATRLATLLETVVHDVLIDAGRLSTSALAAPLVAGADRLVLVARPRLEELTALAHRLEVLRAFGPAPELLLVGDRPYGPDEVADALGVPVLGVLAHDVGAADGLAAAGPVRRLSRRPLLRSATSIVDALVGATEPVATGPVPAVEPDVESAIAPALNGQGMSRRRWPVAGRS